MAQVVVMPQLGNTVESCLVTTWLVGVGDVVDASTLLCEIETDKSSMEVPSGVSGTVLALLAEEGDDVPVKQPIVVIGEPGENVEEFLAGAGLPPVTTGEAGEVSTSDRRRTCRSRRPRRSPPSRRRSRPSPATPKRSRRAHAPSRPARGSPRRRSPAPAPTDA